MDRIRLSHCPPGVFAEVDFEACASLDEVLRLSCQRFAGLPAYSHMGVAMSQDELDRRSRDFATGLALHWPCTGANGRHG